MHATLERALARNHLQPSPEVDDVTRQEYETGLEDLHSRCTVERTNEDRRKHSAVAEGA
jgi:hypothetical protein